MKISSFCLLLLVAFADLIAAESPRLIPFQGRLADSSGNPIPDGVRLIQFQIYSEPSSGSVLWAGELHRATINGGLVNVVLGSKNPLPNDRLDQPDKSFFDQPLCLQITVDTDADNLITAADPPLLPRQTILPVLFAGESANARKLQGYDWRVILADGATNPLTGKLDGNKIVGLGSSNITTAIIQPSHLSPALMEDSLHPPGTVIAWMGLGTNPPAGWEFCWGQVVPRTDPKYARLFSIIATSNGAGTNVSTFHLPDLRGMFLRGVNGSRTNGFMRSSALMDLDANSRTNYLGGSTGNQVGSIQQDEFMEHSHTYPVYAGSYAANGEAAGDYQGAPFRVNRATSVSGGSETRPKNVYVNYLIKL